MTCQNCRGHGHWIDVADGRKYPCVQCSDTEYTNYEPQGPALSIFKQRYAITETETFAEACDRVAYRIAHAETERLYTAMRDLLSILQFLERGGTAWGLTPNEQTALNTIRELLPKTTE